MVTGSLLLNVQMDCAANELVPFNRWYNNHLPNLLQIPGFQWAQRYQCLTKKGRFMALYGLRSEADIPITLGRNDSEFHHIAQTELTGFMQLEGLSNVLVNVYTQVAGSPIKNPLLRDDYPLSIVMADIDPKVEEDWNRWYNESHFANVVKVPGYVAGGRFRAVEHPSLKGTGTGPRYLALYEVENENLIPTLGDEAHMSPEAKGELDNWKSKSLPNARKVSWDFYRMISKHFKWID